MNTPESSSKVHVLFTRINSDINREIYQEYISRLPADFQSRNSRFHQWKDRIRHLSGALLMMDAFERIGFKKEMIDQLVFNEYGRPALPETFNVDFNISHSGDFVLCAITKGSRLGVDIEEIVPVNFHEFEDTMTPFQWAVIKRSGKPETFFDYWTIKESVIKADTRGLSIPLQDILIENGAAFLDNRVWYLSRLEIDKGYSSYLAVNKINAEVIMERINYST